MNHRSVPCKECGAPTRYLKRGSADGYQRRVCDACGFRGLCYWEPKWVLFKLGMTSTYRDPSIKPEQAKARTYDQLTDDEKEIMRRASYKNGLSGEELEQFKILNAELAAAERAKNEGRS